MDDEKKTWVTSTVWPWKQAEDMSEKERAKPRKYALIQLVIMLVAASVFLFVFNRIFVSIIIYFLSFLMLLGILVAPRVLCVFDKLGKILAISISRLLTYLLLVPFYYLCFLPGRMVLSIIRKDPMNRQLHKDTTYWIEKKQAEDIGHYKVQYK